MAGPLNHNDQYHRNWRRRIAFILTVTIFSSTWLLFQENGYIQTLTGQKRPLVIMIDNRVGSSRRSACEALSNALAPNHSSSSPPRKGRLVLEMRTCLDRNMGNMLSHVYVARILAASANLDFTYRCGTWYERVFRGLWGAETLSMAFQVKTTFPEAIRGNYTFHDICKHCDTTHSSSCMRPSLDLGVDLIRADYQALATHTNNVSPADAVIHYRCGDAIQQNGDLCYGLLPHSTYATLLEQHQPIRSIAILTQPFDGPTLRAPDQPYGPRCRRIVHNLVEYLENKFPQASVMIYNSPQDTGRRDFCRMTQARKLAVCGASTYCQFASLATQGVAYFYNHADLTCHEHNWLEPVMEQEPDRVRPFSGQLLASRDAYEMTDDELMSWLQTMLAD